ncbi:hypothetical protein IJT93_03500 [bacterium]|nr:hypothetical protein [bacterium]
MKSCFIVLLAAPVLCLVFGGCSLVKGNNSAEIKEAIEIAEKQYGVNFNIKKKAFFTGGAVCDVIVNCEDLPGKDIRIFRFEERSAVECDYIYVKYGDLAYDRISKNIRSVLPGAKVVVQESGYNHFYGNMYDKNTTLDNYLWNNMFKIDVITYGDYDETGIRTLYNKLAKTITDNGIDSYGFAIYVMNGKEAVDAVKTYEHMPDSQAYIGVTGDDVRLYAAKNFDRLAEYIKNADDLKSLSIRVKNK